MYDGWALCGSRRHDQTVGSGAWLLDPLSPIQRASINNMAAALALSGDEHPEPRQSHDGHHGEASTCVLPDGVADTREVAAAERAHPRAWRRNEAAPTRHRRTPGTATAPHRRYPPYSTDDFGPSWIFAGIKDRPPTLPAPTASNGARLRGLGGGRGHEQSMFVFANRRGRRSFSRAP